MTKCKKETKRKEKTGKASSELFAVTADICPHGGGSSACEWCNYKSQVDFLKADNQRLKDIIADVVESHKCKWYPCEICELSVRRDYESILRDV